jgi:hypothetical protein
MSRGSPYLLDRRLETSPPDAAAYPYDRVEEKRIFEERAVTANMSVQGVKLSTWADRIIDLENGVGGGSVNVPSELFETRTDAIAATISATVDVISTGGYSTAGDGGQGLYKRLGSAPSNPTNRAYFQSADGTYWQLVPQGGEVYIEQFGGKADCTNYGVAGAADTGVLGGTDNLQPLTDAIAFVSWTAGAQAYFSYTIKFGAGNYRFTDGFDLHTICHISGVGGGGQEVSATVLHFPNTCDPFIFGANNTDGASATGAGFGQSTGSVLENVTIRCGRSGSTVDLTRVGILARTQCVIRNVALYRLPGKGIYIRAQAGGGAVLEGNANDWHLENIYIHEAGGDYLHVNGADANGGYCTGLVTHGTSGRGGCAIKEENSLGCNVYIGSQLTGYGNTGVHYTGNWYQLISNTADAGKNTTPGTNDLVWMLIGAGVVTAAFPEWSAATDYTLQLPVFSAGGDSVFVGTYIEGASVASQVLGGGMVLGGNMSVTKYSALFKPLLGSGAGFRASQGIGTRRTFAAGDAEQTRNGSSTWVAMGEPHESNGMGANGGIQLLSFRRVSDVDTSWEWGFRGNDISFRAPNTAQIWEITTASTALEHGKGAADPYRLRLFNPVFVDPDNTNAVGAIKFADAVPASGAHARAEVVFSTNPSGANGSAAGWMATVAGTPGTWKRFGPLMGGTEVTASDPLLDLAQTWNDGGVTFTGLKANFTSTASAANSIMLDLQMSGSSKWKADKDGDTTQTGTATIVSGTAATAGGAAMVSMTSGAVSILVGSGAPSASAAKGSLYLRTDGSSTSTRMYVNTDAGTTWTAVTTAA